MLTLTDGRSQLEDAVRYALAISPHVTPDLLERPTPCASWDLRMLLDHLSESVGVLAEGLATCTTAPAGQLVPPGPAPRGQPGDHPPDTPGGDGR